MPDQQDDRITSFIKRDGMVSDAEFMIELINQIKGAIKGVGTIKFKLESASSLRQTADLIAQLSTQYGELTRQKQLLADETQRLTAAMRGEKDAAKGATVPNRPLSTAPQPSGTSGPQVEGSEEVEQTAGAYRELKQAVDDAWQSYTNLITTSGMLSTETAKAYEQYKLLKGELLAIDRIKQLKIDLSGIENLSPEIQDKINRLDQLQEELGITKGLFAEGVGDPFGLMDEDASKLRAEIAGLTKELVDFIATEQQAVKAGSFDQLVKEAQAAKKVFNDLRTDFNNGTGGVQIADVNAAMRHWKQLEQRIREVKAAEKDAFQSDVTSRQQRDLLDLKNRLQQYEAALKKAKIEMAQLAQTDIGRHSPAYQQAKASVAQYGGVIAVLNNEMAKLSKNEKQRQLAAREGAKAVKNAEAEISAAKQLESIYNALTASLKQLQAEAQELSARNFLGIAQPGDAEQLAKVRANITELSGALAKMDAELGRSARNQYGYTQQLFSLQQVLRELPNAAFGFSTLISALSNNIPILFDDIDNLKRKNKELAAAGLPVVSVTDKIIESIFSWQTAIIALVTVLTVWGDEIGDYILSLFRTDAANRKAYEATQKYAEIQRELAQATKELTEAFAKLNAIRQQGTDMGIKKLERELQVMQALGVSADKLFSIERERIQLVQNRANIQVETTSGGIADQRLQTGRLNITRDLADLKALNKEMVLSKNNEANATEVLINGVKVLTKEEAQEIEKRKQNQLKAQIEVAKARVDASAAGIRDAKTFNNELATLDSKRSKGEITNAEYETQVKKKQLEFLEKQREAANKRSEQSNAKFRQAELEFEKELLRVSENRGDKDKDEKVKAAKEKKEAAQRQFEIDQELNQQALEALEVNNDAIKEADEQLNKERKTLSDQHRQVVLANAEREASIIKTVNGDILADEASTLDQRLKALNALKEAERSLALARFNDVKTNLSSSNADILAARAQLASELKDIDVQYARESLETQFEFYVRYQHAIRDIRKAELDYTIQINEQIRDSIENNLQERLKAEEKIIAARRQLAKDDFDRQLVDAGFTQEDIRQLEAGNREVLKGKRLTVKEIEALEADHQRVMKGLVLGGIKDNTSILKAEYDRQENDYREHVQRIEELSGSISFDNSQDLFEQELILRDSLKKREIGVFEYERRLEELRKAARARDLQDAKVNIQEQIDLLIAKFGDRKALEGKIKIGESIVDAIRAKLNDPGLSQEQRISLQADLDVNQKSLDTARSKLKDLIDLFEQLTGINLDEVEFISDEEIKKLENAQKILTGVLDTLNSLNSIFDSFAERGFDIRAAQTEKERELIEQSVAGEEERAKLLGELRVQEAADRERLEQRRKKLEYDRAKQEKQSALTSIGIELAKTLAQITIEIAKAAASGNPIKAAIAATQYAVAIAASAAQTAAVASKPLPEYARGTDYHPGGYAVLGDAYKSEMAVTPEGELIFTKAEPHILNLPKGTKVYPDAQKAMAQMEASTETRQAYARLQKAGQIVPAILPPADRLQLMQRMMAEEVLSRTIQAAQSIGVSIQVPGMEQMAREMKKGFSELNQTMKKNKTTIVRSGNALKFFNYGSDYDKIK